MLIVLLLAGAAWIFAEIAAEVGEGETRSFDEWVLLAMRVPGDPAPGMQLSGFGADGMDLTLNFWICNPENGQGNVKSDVNLAVLALFDAEGIQIPFPQRVVHTVAVEPKEAS